MSEDAEIAELNNKIVGLTKQRNAYKTADDARNKLIDWKVETGVKERIKELNSLSSERDANAILTGEIEQLNAEVAQLQIYYKDKLNTEVDEVMRLQNVNIELNAKVAMMCSLLTEVTSANDYLNSNWFDARQAIFNATEADVTKFLNGIRADAVADYLKQAHATMCAKVVR